MAIGISTISEQLTGDLSQSEGGLLISHFIRDQRFGDGIVVALIEVLIKKLIYELLGVHAFFCGRTDG